eukprot:TRINITY_DN5702_c1_g1_i7.p1 TRINITY_DN5702_c1_g1~~TRINITY_DN5702_c1_g1_i7.p1  ORF type:complete len:404 (+),score=38.75 TRINITY_DN5702_c1_g1_i7:41-1252(+)
MSNVRQKTPSRAYADDGLFREERAPRTARVAAAPSRTPQMRLSIGGRASRTARVAAAPSRTPQMRLSIGGRASRSNSRRPQSEKIRAGKLVTPLWRRDSSARLNPLINQRPCSKHVVTSSRLRTTPLPVTRSSPPPPILKRKRLPEDSQSRVPRLVGRTNNVATNREGKEHTISIHSKQPVRRVVVRKRIVRRGGVLKRPAGVGAVDRIHSNRQYGYAKPRKDMLPVDLPPREADPLHMQEEEQISSEEVGEMDLEEETSYVMSDEDICRDQHNEISEDVMAEGYRYQQREVEDVSSEENARREEERKEWDRGKATVVKAWPLGNYMGVKDASTDMKGTPLRTVTITANGTKVEERTWIIRLSEAVCQPLHSDTGIREHEERITLLRDGLRLLFEKDQRVLPL